MPPLPLWERPGEGQSRVGGVKVPAALLILQS
jgi:hypothetical protein